jgi:hypothetical protein
MKRLIVSITLSVFISAIVFLTLNDFGITWDEPIHLRNADRYVSWLKRPALADKDAVFSPTVDDVHPPFRKLIAGLTHEIFTNNLKVIDNTRGYRVSSLLFVVPFITCLTYVAIGHLGYTVGILVPFMFSFLPHVFFLTPLVTMDYAIAALWFIAVITGIKGTKQYFWLIVSALSIALTMLTKLHGFLLFLPVGGYLLWKKKYTRFFVFVVTAFATYIVFWPWLWTHTIVHLQEYFRIQTAHGSVPEYIFGKTYAFAPWWYTGVMFLTTTPAIILILFIIGAFTVDRIILLNALFPIVFFSLAGVYRYDWVRLFLPAFPFICLVAGRGILQCKRIFLVVIVAAWFFTVYTSVIRIHPWESAYYNEFVGGIAGAYEIGMESEFWGNSYLAVLPWMNANKKHAMCVTPTTHPFYYYQAMGQIEPGVVFTADKMSCDYVVVLMRQGLFIRDPFIASVVHTQKPIHTVSVDGVALVGVYDIRNIKK